MISLRNLTKTYGSARAVDGLSLEVTAGEIVGLIGPNGAGKTSTLRCLAGIHRPTSGSVLIGGHDIVGEPVEAKRRIAFVGDEPHLFEHLTVMEHLRLARLAGSTLEQIVMYAAMLLLAVVLIVPVAGAFAAYYVAGGLLIPAATFAALMIAECLAATEIIGRILDRTDLQDVAVAA